jgi:ergothioneine biosynthesis protein EgtB
MNQSRGNVERIIANGDLAQAERFAQVRARTERLAQPLSAEDCALQSMPDASPVKWHLAHTTWFFETFVLEAAIPGYQPYDPQFRSLFNSYYIAVGPRHPRPERGLLSRPSLDAILAYRRHVNSRITAMMDAGAPAWCDLIELGIQHEQQHQELILTDLKHLLSRNPLAPVYAAAPPPAITVAPARSWQALPDGIRLIGHDGGGFCFDNELPRHRVFLDAFEIATRPVTNGEYGEFIADGGYDRHELWLSEGWDVKIAEDWLAPLYWRREGAGWVAFTLHGLRVPDPAAPVCHVSFFEADAFARWSGARLPTEAEWESYAATQQVSGHFAEDGCIEPRAAGVAAATQVFGDVWEWTRSAYEPYPGYRTAPGAVGEYNGKFMSNQYVLRGGSCATPRSHIRVSYRNFFPAAARWQFSGIRLARDSS